MSEIATSSPTVSEMLNAANWEYQKTGFPADLAPFMIDGHQLTFTDQQAGISAHAWQTPEHQVVVSFEGTQAISLSAAALDPAFSFRQVVEDTGVAQGNVTTGEREAAAFASQVASAAAAEGISSSNVFVTGHSLGGIQAEYAAQQTGLGGIAFESTGLARSSTTAGTGTNFVNVVQYGDPVANYASDIAAEQPFAPAYAPGGTGALPHYGYVAMIGDPAAQAALTQAAALSDVALSSSLPAGAALTTALYGVGLAAYHVPNVQAHSLGVDLTQYGASEVVGDRSGPVLDAADYTIADLVQATNATLSAPLPPDPAVSPRSGGAAGFAAIALSEAGDVTAATHITQAAAAIDHLLLPAGGTDAPDPAAPDNRVAQAFMATESHVSGELSHLFDAIGAHGADIFSGHHIDGAQLQLQASVVI